jgi:hypothetical protein
MLLQPDADGMTGRPQVAAVICRFRIFRALRIGNMCSDRNLVTDWTWTACTRMTRHGVQRDSSNACNGHSAASVAAGLLLCEHGSEAGAGRKHGTVHCSIYAAAWTDLRSLHWHRRSSTINRQRNAAGRQQSTTKYLQCLRYQLCCTLCMDLLSDSGIRDALEKAYV